MIFYNNHGPVARVFQQQRLLEDQRCAVFDRTLGSTTTTTTANRVLTTTVTQTTHTANFSDYHVDITSLMSTQLSLSTTVAALTTRLSTVEQANDELTSTVFLTWAVVLTNLHVLLSSGPPPCPCVTVRRVAVVLLLCCCWCPCLPQC